MKYDQMNKRELQHEIKKLKIAKNCFIIAHNYQFMEVQEIADYVGDSLQMAKVAAKTNADMILLCGIKIMAETAKILNPDKKVLMAHHNADCQLANMQPPAELIKLKMEYPDAEVVCYVNSPAALKAESTITCTSANAVDVVSKLPKDRPVIFVPDRNIGAWVEYKTGRKLVMFDSCCYVHDQISFQEAEAIRMRYPNHKLLVHPECNLDVCLLADRVCSTSQMIDFVQNHDQVIIGTEYGLFEQLLYHYPQKDLVSLSSRMICDDMKKTDLKTVVKTLAEENNELIIDENIMERSRISLERMLEIMN